jgi:hypothetical protein
MARFAVEDPHLMLAEYEFWAHRNKVVKKEDEVASLSRVVKVESDDEVKPSEHDGDEEDNIDSDNLSDEE